MSDFLTDFLAVILHEQGVENPHEVAEKAAADLYKVKVVDHRRVDTVAKHRKIDQLRGQGVSCADIAKRLDMTREAVARIVTEQLELRRAS